MIIFDIKSDKDYNIEGEFYFKHHINLIPILTPSTSFIYGEFGIPDTFDISLSRISHIIDDITISKSGNVKIKGRVLNTSNGVLLKELIDDGVIGALCFYLRFAKNSNGVINRIFTFDIDLKDKFIDPVEKLRNERKLKLVILDNLKK